MTLRLIRLFAIISLVIPATSLLAATELGIIPRQLDAPRSWFSYTLKPGEVVEDVAQISNNTGRDIIASIIPLDTTNLSNGGFELVQNPSENRDLATWIKVETPELTIPAGASQDVPFKLEVPANASIGEHAAGIAVRESGQAGAISATARVLVTVPGLIQRELKWEKVDHEFKDGKLIFHVKAKNNSNIQLRPTLDIEYKSLFGTKRQSELENGTVPAKGTITINSTWQHLTPMLGYYRFQLTLHTLTVTQTLENGQQQVLPDEKITTTVSFWTGTGLLIWIILILLGLWLLFRTRAYFTDRRRLATKVNHHKIRPGESLMHIAAQTGVHPKKIIKFNRLAWPYALTTGEHLLIPLGRNDFSATSSTGTMPGYFTYLFSFKNSHYQHQVPDTRGQTQSVEKTVRRTKATKASKPVAKKKTSTRPKRK